MDRINDPFSPWAAAVFRGFLYRHAQDEQAFCFGPLLGKKLTIVVELMLLTESVHSRLPHRSEPVRVVTPSLFGFAQGGLRSKRRRMDWVPFTQLIINIKIICLITIEALMKLKLARELPTAPSPARAEPHP